MWFNKKHIKIDTIIELDDIQGYVLPHAGTKYTGEILSHTLRFKPKKIFNDILIIYYPVSDKPNVKELYYHEYYVVWKSLKYAIEKYWKINVKINFIPFNLREKYDKNIRYNENTLLVVSADFSHFLPLSLAIESENCASKSLLYKNFNHPCIDVVDDEISFKKLYSIIPNNFILQWIGRTRSPGFKGVGYLSYLIRDTNKITRPDGFFVTIYDNEMNARECLGEWKLSDNWQDELNKFIEYVAYLAKTESRLTSGMYKNVPIKFYTITHLYRDKSKKFIRGWHSIMHNSFFLSDVFLENTYDNGIWIKDNDPEWPQDKDFDLSESLLKLGKKFKGFGGRNLTDNYKLYTSKVVHGTL